jgi:hypothetical protein
VYTHSLKFDRAAKLNGHAWHVWCLTTARAQFRSFFIQKLSPTYPSTAFSTPQLDLFNFAKSQTIAEITLPYKHQRHLKTATFIVRTNSMSQNTNKFLFFNTRKQKVIKNAHPLKPINLLFL